MRHSRCRRAILEDRLTAAGAAHLSSCIECRALSDGVADVLRAAVAMEPPPPRPGFVERLVAQVGAQTVRHPHSARTGLGTWRRGMPRHIDLRFVAAAVSLAILSGAVGGLISRSAFPTPVTGPPPAAPPGTPPPPTPSTGAHVDKPTNVAVDAANDLFVVDSQRVFEVLPGGVTRVILSSAGGGFVTGSALAVSTTGIVYVAETVPDNGTSRVVQLAPGGREVPVQGTLATSGNTEVRGVSVGPDGTIYVARLQDLNAALSDVVAVSPVSGKLTTIAGGGRSTGETGRALDARIAAPGGLALDAAGDLFVSDTATSRVLEVAASGSISVVAGVGQAGFTGDGGPAVGARLDRPTGLAVDASGNLYIADSGNNRVRRVARDGRITTVAGSGAAGFRGDGGTAVMASLSAPEGVAVDKSGNLYIADTGNSRIREVSIGGVITSAL